MASHFIPGVAGVTTSYSPDPPVAAAPGYDDRLSQAVDGTPVRVVGILVASAVGLYALRVAGFRFNVGVSA